MENDASAKQQKKLLTFTDVNKALNKFALGGFNPENIFANMADMFMVKLQNTVVLL